jgi:hypothetical protein
MHFPGFEKALSWGRMYDMQVESGTLGGEYLSFVYEQDDGSRTKMKCYPNKFTTEKKEPAMPVINLYYSRYKTAEHHVSTAVTETNEAVPQ